eukprot:189035-Prymnesium_polylepis.1
MVVVRDHHTEVDMMVTDTMTIIPPLQNTVFLRGRVSAAGVGGHIYALARALVAVLPVKKEIG